MRMPTHVLALFSVFMEMMRAERTLDKDTKSVNIKLVCEPFAKMIHVQALQFLIIPASVQVIPTGFFRNARLGCIAFEKGSRISIIQEKAFASARIQSIMVPGSVRQLGELCCSMSSFGHFAFSTTKVVSTLPAQFCAKAFFRSNVQSVCIPANVREIWDSCFEECRCLKSISFEVGSQLAEIGRRAFAHSTLETIHLPRRLCSIGAQAFMCFYLQNVTVDPENEHYSVREAFLMNKAGTSIFSQLYFQVANVPDTVEVLEKSCFEMWKPLKCVSFGSQSHLRVIRELAFAKTTLLELCLPASVSEVHGRAFAFSIIANFSIDPANPNFVFEGGLLLNRDKTLLVRHIHGDTVNIPPTVKVIGKHAFDGIVGPNGLTLNYPPDCQLETIETGAFNMSSITEIFIPKTVTLIMPNAFSDPVSVPIRVEPGNTTYRVVAGSLTDIAGNILTRSLA